MVKQDWMQAPMLLPFLQLTDYETFSLTNEQSIKCCPPEWSEFESPCRPNILALLQGRKYGCLILPFMKMVEWFWQLKSCKSFSAVQNCLKSCLTCNILSLCYLTLPRNVQNLSLYDYQPILLSKNTICCPIKKPASATTNFITESSKLLTHPTTA